VATSLISPAQTESRAADAKQPNWIIAPAVGLVVFMQVLDISIANLSLYHIAGSLSANLDEVTWVLTSYLTASAISLPASGWLSSVIGRKRFYLISIGCFGATSLVCGLASNILALVAFRAAQGLAGGVLQPVSQAILFDSFPPAQRRKAVTVYTLAVVLGPVIGPTLGGWITETLSWRWVFLINAPISALLFFVIDLKVTDPVRLAIARKARLGKGISVDYVGLVLLAVGFGSLQFVLDKGGAAEWFASSFITILAVLAACSIIAFVARQLAASDPILDLALLRNPNFATGNLLMFMVGFMLMSTTVLLPRFAQSLLGYTATDAGTMMSPGGLVIMCFTPVVSVLLQRVDVRHLIVFGLFANALALWGMTQLDLATEFSTVTTLRMAQSLGFAFLFIPVYSLAFADMRRDSTDHASTIIIMSRTLGNSVGIALMVTLLSHQTLFHLANSVVEQTARYPEFYSDLVRSISDRLAIQGGSPAETFARAQAIAVHLLQQQALLASFRDNFMLLAAVSAALIIVVLVVRRRSAAVRRLDDRGV
jgi:MFS transporter, DHA2 family, multidrug resistance protein